MKNAQLVFIMRTECKP